LTLNDTFFSQ